MPTMPTYHGQPMKRLRKSYARNRRAPVVPEAEIAEAIAPVIQRMKELFAQQDRDRGDGRMPSGQFAEGRKGEWQRRREQI